MVRTTCYFHSSRLRGLVGGAHDPSPGMLTGARQARCPTVPGMDGWRNPVRWARTGRWLLVPIAVLDWFTLVPQGAFVAAFAVAVVGLAAVAAALVVRMLRGRRGAMAALGVVMLLGGLAWFALDPFPGVLPAHRRLVAGRRHAAAARGSAYWQLAGLGIELCGFGLLGTLLVAALTRPVGGSAPRRVTSASGAVGSSAADAVDEVRARGDRERCHGVDVREPVECEHAVGEEHEPVTGREGPFDVRARRRPAAGRSAGRACAGPCACRPRPRCSARPCPASTNDRAPGVGLDPRVEQRRDGSRRDQVVADLGLERRTVRTRVRRRCAPRRPPGSSTRAGQQRGPPPTRTRSSGAACRRRRGASRRRPRMSRVPTSPPAGRVRGPRPGRASCPLRTLRTRSRSIACPSSRSAHRARSVSRSSSSADRSRGSASMMQSVPTCVPSGIDSGAPA